MWLCVLGIGCGCIGYVSCVVGKGVMESKKERVVRRVL